MPTPTNSDLDTGTAKGPGVTNRTPCRQTETVLTYGLDLSTSPKKSAVVAIEWSRTGAQVVQLHQPVDTQQIINLIVGSDGWWAVDVPFGWPEPFVEFIRDHQVGPVTRTDPARWEQWRTSEISLRETDRHVHDATGVRPLPAAFQLLGATAAHWAVIEAELASKGVVIDRAGLTPRLIETYPSAVLAGWGIQRSPKPTWPVLKPFLGPLKVDGFESLLEANDDARDALICALVARARALELTDLPTDQQTDLAQAEGWIHLPTASPNQLFERGSHLSELDRDPSLRRVDREDATKAGDPDLQRGPDTPATAWPTLRSPLRPQQPSTGSRGGRGLRLVLPGATRPGSSRRMSPGRWQLPPLRRDLASTATRKRRQAEQSDAQVANSLPLHRQRRGIHAPTHVGMSA